MLYFCQSSMAFPCAVIFAIIKDALTIPFNSALAHKEEMLREKPKLASGCIALTDNAEYSLSGSPLYLLPPLLLWPQMYLLSEIFAMSFVCLRNVRKKRSRNDLVDFLFQF